MEEDNRLSQGEAQDLTSFHPETPDVETFGFRIGKKLFFVLARRYKIPLATFIKGVFMIARRRT